MNTRLHRTVLRHSRVPLLAAALAIALMGLYQAHSSPLAAAPGDGQLRLDPQSKTVIETHIFSIPVAMTTCADVENDQCHIGAYDLTLNFDDTRLALVQDGYVATGATTTTLTVAGEAWKLNQWAGSAIHITNGPGLGQKRVVVSNTVDTVTITPAFNPPPATQPGPNSIFQIGGITDGGFLGSSGRTINCLGASYSSSSAQLECVTLGAEIEGAHGTGTLTNLVVQANARGVASLSLTGVQILEIDGTAIPVDVFNGARRVILCPDANSDGKVSSIDLSQIAQRFNILVGDPLYTLTRDPNEDGKISSIDLSLTSQVFGLRCVQP
jgi:hypothetical protein